MELHNPIRIYVSDKVRELRKRIKPIAHNLSTEELLTKLISMGGVISGGAALAAYKKSTTKDIDIYFNNDAAYIEATGLVKHLSCDIDVCYYINQPHELHDLSAVMVNIIDGDIVVTPKAKKALDSGLSRLYSYNVIYPLRTAIRMMKYKAKYGFLYEYSDVAMFCNTFDVNKNLKHYLIMMCGKQPC